MDIKVIAMKIDIQKKYFRVLLMLPFSYLNAGANEYF
jgi:hypothetical protein